MSLLAMQDIAVRAPDRVPSIGVAELAPPANDPLPCVVAAAPSKKIRWERNDPVEFATTDTVWRDFLAEQGVAAAILSLQLRGVGGQRHAYLVGLDDAREDTVLARDMLAYVEKIWDVAGGSSASTYSASDLRQPRLFERVEHAPVLSGLLDRLGHGLALEAHYKLASVRAMFFRSSDGTAFSARDRRELGSVLPLLVEHGVARARLASENQRTELLESVVDRVSVPILILEADARPVFLNGSAKALLNSRRCLLRAPDGMVTCVNTGQAKLLRGAIKSAAFGYGEGPDRIVRLDGTTGDWRLAQIMPADRAPNGLNPGCAIMIVLSPGTAAVPDIVLEALGLLPSEQRFLGRFLRSSSVGEAARRCGISEETARTYLKRVRAKLGVSRQMELATLISGLALPIAARTSSEVF